LAKANQYQRDPVVSLRKCTEGGGCYVAGLEDLSKSGGNLKKIASVASFFISRIDSLVDSMIDDKLKTAADPQQKTLLNGLKAKLRLRTASSPMNAISESSADPGGEALSAKGAQTQRVLWASTQHEESRPIATSCMWRS